MKSAWLNKPRAAAARVFTQLIEYLPRVFVFVFFFNEVLEIVGAFSLESTINILLVYAEGLIVSGRGGSWGGAGV